jgi:hypothetical protein
MNLLKAHALCLALLLPLGAAAAGTGEADAATVVQVEAPYVELHTGPGVGYPVFSVAEKGARLRIDLRRTDWFRVQAPDGRIGWVARGEIEATRMEQGPLLGEALQTQSRAAQWEGGGAWGHFAGDPAFKVWGAWRALPTLSLELALTQVDGRYSSASLAQLDLVLEPMAARRLSPFFGVGVGRMRNVPNASLVTATPVNANTANAMIGLHLRLTPRLLARLDWTDQSALVSGARTASYRATLAGLTFHF